MKSLLIFLASVSLSVSALAGGMADYKDINGAKDKVSDSQINESILKNKKMQRLHEEMTRYGLSEVGMEARRKMMSEQGRAYHRALEKSQSEKHKALKR
jgi:hypothetical protein